MQQVELEEAKAHFVSLIQTALAGEEIVITENERPVLKLTPVASARPRRRRSGSAKGLVKMADDFDAPLADFNEYMQ
jgi:antitoxin (DNA-binding transcriptional repressor) of toxin-antitoxin stability system